MTHSSNISVLKKISFLRGLMTFHLRTIQLVLFSLPSILFVGCDGKSQEALQSEPPPLTQRLQPIRCAAGEPVAGVKGLSAQTKHCVAQNADIARYGLGSRQPLGDVCTQLFNGECELYKSFGLRGVTTAQIVPEAGGEYFVQLTVSQFQDSIGAFGFYSHRLLGDEHPRHITVESLKVDGRGALGLGIAYLFRGQMVWELTYLSDSETPTQVKNNSPGVLAKLTQSIARAAVGVTAPPHSVGRLEEEPGLWPLGVKFEAEGIWDLPGAGKGSVAYIREGQAHRVLLAEREDERGAKDLLAALLRSGPFKKLKGTNVYRVRRHLSQKDDERWYFERRGKRLIGLSRDAQHSNVVGAKERKKFESEFEVFALKRLQKFR